MIICRQLSKSFELGGKRVSALEDVDISVADRESVAVLGPSGCGKSTLLRLIAGFFPPDSGTVEVSGRVSLMAQNDMLLERRTVLSNACLPIEIRDPKRLPAARDEVRALLPLFGLEGFADSYPAQLSGGMRQRAALLRTVVDNGDFWLLDEPFARLDALTKEELQEWLFGIRSRYQPGVLLVTHDIGEALRLCDRIYVLSSRPGRVLAELQTDRSAAADQHEYIRSLLK